MDESPVRQGLAEGAWLVPLSPGLHSDQSCKPALRPLGPSCSGAAVSIHPPAPGSLCHRHPGPYPFWSPPHPLPEPPRGWGRDYCARCYLVIKKKTNRKMCAASPFFFFWLHRNASGFQMATQICPILLPGAASLCLAPGGCRAESATSAAWGEAAPASCEQGP